jgi:hypothetical protein
MMASTSRSSIIENPRSPLKARRGWTPGIHPPEAQAACRLNRRPNTRLRTAAAPFLNSESHFGWGEEGTGGEKRVFDHRFGDR